MHRLTYSHRGVSHSEAEERINILIFASYSHLGVKRINLLVLELRKVMYSCRFAQGTMQNQMSLWLRPHIKVSGFHDCIEIYSNKYYYQTI